MKKETKGADGIPDTYSACSGDNDVYFYLNKESDTWEFVCEENQWPFWQNYFDFETDYVAYNNIIRKSDDVFLKDALKDSFGMRILRQDLWEVFISYVISQNNNIPKIKKSIQTLCDRYSDGIHFPKPEVLACIPEQELMDGTALGYRADYIIGISKKPDHETIFSHTSLYRRAFAIRPASQCPERGVDGAGHGCPDRRASNRCDCLSHAATHRHDY